MSGTLTHTAPAAMLARAGLLVYAGAALLVFSIAPEIIWSDVIGGSLGWIAPARLAALTLLLGAGLALPALRPLWKLAALLLALTVGGQLLGWVTRQPAWTGLLAVLPAGPLRDLWGVQFGKLGVSLVVLAALAALGYRRRVAYLTLGDMNTPAGPERWLGFPRPESWGRFGTKWLLFLSVGMIVILCIFGRPTLASLTGAWQFVPVVLALSAFNAFNEELTYRAALLAPLVPALGARPAHWLTAALFGLSHYYGVPYGLGGVALSCVMGWFLGKAMLETRGFGWPWLLHLIADVWIFYFLLAGSVVAGG